MTCKVDYLSMSSFLKSLTFSSWSLHHSPPPLYTLLCLLPEGVGSSPCSLRQQTMRQVQTCVLLLRALKGKGKGRRERGRARINGEKKRRLQTRQEAKMKPWNLSTYAEKCFRYILFLITMHKEGQHILNKLHNVRWSVLLGLSDEKSIHFWFQVCRLPLNCEVEVKMPHGYGIFSSSSALE